MSNSDDSELVRDNMNPLTEAIFEAAEDLEQGRSLGPSPDPLAAAEPAAAEQAAPAPEVPAAPVEAPAPVVEEQVPAAPVEKGPSFFSRLAEANPYTVILAVSLLALMTGAVLLVLEWSSYGWEVKATGGLG